jgi:hypothetical protein
VIQDQKKHGNDDEDFEKTIGHIFLPFLERMDNIGSNVRNTIRL